MQVGQLFPEPLIYVLRTEIVGLDVAYGHLSQCLSGMLALSQNYVSIISGISPPLFSLHLFYFTLEDSSYDYLILIDMIIIKLFLNITLESPC